MAFGAPMRLQPLVNPLAGPRASPMGSADLCARRLLVRGWRPKHPAHVPQQSRDEIQYTAPRAVIGQTCSTRLPRTHTYQS